MRTLIFGLLALFALSTAALADEAKVGGKTIIHLNSTLSSGKCPKCGHENKPGAKFCQECGAAMQADACPKCGDGVTAAMKFCPNCGVNLADAKPHAEAPAAKDAPPVRDEGAQSGKDAETFPQMHIIGFGDVTYSATDMPGATNSFSLGQLDLFVNSRLSDRISVLDENVIEADSSNAFGFEIERLMVQYNVSDALNIAFGRYHTAIGFYNTAYHHGTWLQIATGRPFLFEFEDGGGPLPIHNVGISLSGRIPSGKLGLRYVAEVGNGRTSRSPADEPVQNVIDENNGKAFNLALIARPECVNGLQTGVSFYRDTLHPIGGPDVRQSILALHGVIQRPDFEWLNEGVFIMHNTAGSTITTPAFYTQVAKQVGKVKPYFRYQWINAPAGDPIIGGISLRHGPSLGVRYDVGELMALKLQWDKTWIKGMGGSNMLTLQSAFTF